MCVLENGGVDTANIHYNGSTEVKRDLTVTLTSGKMRKILFTFQESFYFLFSCYLYYTCLENLHDKGELCKVNMVRDDYVWLSDAVAPLPT